MLFNLGKEIKQIIFWLLENQLQTVNFASSRLSLHLSARKISTPTG